MDSLVRQEDRRFPVLTDREVHEREGRDRGGDPALPARVEKDFARDVGRDVQPLSGAEGGDVGDDPFGDGAARVAHGRDPGSGLVRRPEGVLESVADQPPVHPEEGFVEGRAREANRHDAFVVLAHEHRRPGRGRLRVRRERVDVLRADGGAAPRADRDLIVGGHAGQARLEPPRHGGDDAAGEPEDDLAAHGVREGVGQPADRRARPLPPLGGGGETRRGVDGNPEPAGWARRSTPHAEVGEANPLPGPEVAAPRRGRRAGRGSRSWGTHVVGHDRAGPAGREYRRSVALRDLEVDGPPDRHGSTGDEGPGDLVRDPEGLGEAALEPRGLAGARGEEHDGEGLFRVSREYLVVRRNTREGGYPASSKTDTSPAGVGVSSALMSSMFRCRDVPTRRCPSSGPGRPRGARRCGRSRPRSRSTVPRGRHAPEARGLEVV